MEMHEETTDDPGTVAAVGRVRSALEEVRHHSRTSAKIREYFASIRSGATNT